MSAPDLTLFEDEARFQEAAVMFLRECLDAATKNNKKTTLFLSGGSTPGPIYQRLSEQKLKWSRIAIAQVDDRWVGLQDPGSNAALLKRTILKGAAKNARFVRMKSRHHKAVKLRWKLSIRSWR
jgi:6-phosphogluconolactonase